MAADDLSAYPHNNKIFVFYTYASDYQLGACIIQNFRPVTYFTKKLSKSQLNYTTMEKGTSLHIRNSERFQIYVTWC